MIKFGLIGCGRISENHFKAVKLVNDAKILLFDEPTANLDRKNSQNFISLMQELKSQEKTIIIATHDPIFEECSLIDKEINIEDGLIV